MTQLELKSFLVQLQKEVFPGSECLILSGSGAKNQMTKGSDVDVLILYRKVSLSHSKLFNFKGKLVDATIHDGSTLVQHMLKQERSSANPFYVMTMKDGIPQKSVPHINKLKEVAAAIWKAGPAPATRAQINDFKILATRRLEDLHNCKDVSEKVLLCAQTYERLAVVYLRGQRKWIALGGRELSRLLKVQAPQMHAEFEKAFESFWTKGNLSLVDALAIKVLASAGGPPIMFHKQIHPPPSRAV
jgi:hypothetical protein